MELTIERRQILARYTAVRIAVASFAAIVVLAGLALVDVAFFLAMRPYLSDLGAVLLIAGVHILIGALLAALALREPTSAKLISLTEAELTALHQVSEDASDIVAQIEAAQRRIEQIGQNLLPRNFFRQLFSGGPFGAAALEAAREQTRQNIELLEKAMSLWSPLTGNSSKEAPAAKTAPNSSDEAGPARAELTVLQEQLAAMQRQLDKLSEP